MLLTGAYELVGDYNNALLTATQDVKLNGLDKHASVNNIKHLINKIDMKPENTTLILNAYNILINSKNIGHVELVNFFIGGYHLPASNALNSNDESLIFTREFQQLINDENFVKSLTLFPASHRIFEELLSRARNELLLYLSENKYIPKQYQRFANALAIQCFLNEYVYDQTGK